MEKIIKEVLEKLGKDSYIVGGYVRDKLLNIKSYDIDITTKRTKKELETIFNLPVNVFGGLNFTKQNYNFTITCFRKDLVYNKKGFPQKIDFLIDLKTDLKRRDFTINAICLDKDEKIIDYEKGLNDLKNKKIKTIGKAQERIKEDPLRIFRAIRLACNLDFALDEELFKAIKENKNLINNLSKEKIIKECNKIKDKEKAINLMQKLEIYKEEK